MSSRLQYQVEFKSYLQVLNCEGRKQQQYKLYCRI